MLLLSLWVGRSILGNLAAPDAPVGIAFDFADFRDTTWTPTLDFLAGHIPWDTASYQERHPNAQPFLLYVPSYWPFALVFVQLPYPVVVGAWIVLSITALVTLVTVSLSRLWPAAAARAPWLILPVSIFFVLTPPAKYSVYTGNWESLCSAAAAAVLLTSSPRTLAGMLCVAVVKPQVGIPAAVSALMTRRIRPVLTAAAVSTLLALPVLLLVWHRAGGLGPMLSIMMNNVGAADQELETRALPRVDLAHFLWLSVGDIPSWVSLLAVLATLVATLSVYVVATRTGMSSALAASSWGLFMVLVTPNLLYATIALIPGIIATAREVWEHGRGGRWARLVLPAIALCMMVFPFVNFYRLFPMLGSTLSAGYFVNALLLSSSVLVCLGWFLLERRSGSAGELPMPQRDSSQGPPGQHLQSS